MELKEEHRAESPPQVPFILLVHLIRQGRKVLRMQTQLLLLRTHSPVQLDFQVHLCLIHSRLALRLRHNQFSRVESKMKI